MVGARFWPGAVAAALGTGADDGGAGAAHASPSATWCASSPTRRMADEPEYRFRHVLVSDVCYERLPLAERIARHIRTADWLEARLDSRGTELAEVRGPPPVHRLRRPRVALGLDADPYAAPALAALRQAARRAAMLNAFDAAAAHVARASQLVVGPPARRRASDRDRARAWSCSAIELAFHQDATAFLGGPRARPRWPSWPTLLYRAGDLRRGRPGLDPARPDRLADGRPGRGAALPGPRGRALRHLARTRRRRRRRTPSWAGCTCSTTSTRRRSARPRSPPRSPNGWAWSSCGPTR